MKTDPKMCGRCGLTRREHVGSETACPADKWGRTFVYGKIETPEETVMRQELYQELELLTERFIGHYDLKTLERLPHILRSFGYKLAGNVETQLEDWKKESPVKFMVVQGEYVLARNLDSKSEARRWLTGFRFERSGFPQKGIEIVPEPKGMRNGELPILKDGQWARPTTAETLREKKAREKSRKALVQAEAREKAARE